MTLLRKIQDAAIDSQTNIGDVLRQCAVLAVRLRNEPFKKWVGISGSFQGPYRVCAGKVFLGPNRCLSHDGAGD
jgi:AbiTii-like protein